MRRNRKEMALGLAYLLLAGVALTNSGCLFAVAGAAAAAGGTAYAYSQGKVERAYVADLPDVQSAVRASLAELRMPLVEEQRDKSTGTMTTRTAEDVKVTIDLDTRPGKIPADGPITTVGIRVAVFGDHEVSNRILDQIGMHLAYAPQPGAPVPTTGPTPGPGPTALRPLSTEPLPVGGIVPVAGQSQSPPPPLAEKP